MIFFVPYFLFSLSRCILYLFRFFLDLCEALPHPLLFFCIRQLLLFQNGLKTLTVLNNQKQYLRCTISNGNKETCSPDRSVNSVGRDPERIPCDSPTLPNATSSLQDLYVRGHFGAVSIIGIWQTQQPELPKK